MPIADTTATLLPSVAAAMATWAADPPRTGVWGVPSKDSSSIASFPATTRSMVTGKRTKC